MPLASFTPDLLSPPGDTLADVLEDRELSQADLARRTGTSLKHINHVVRGTASISAEFALALEKTLATPADFWLRREADYRAQLARREEQAGLDQASYVDWAKTFPIRELKQRGCIRSEAKGAPLVEDLLRFLGIASPDLWAAAEASYRKSRKFTSDDFALTAWLRVGELAAQEIHCEPFDRDAFKAVVQDIRSLTRTDPSGWGQALQARCAASGVAVVVVDTFKGARANGATRWLTPKKAVIQLSLRHRWEDIFWFSFFHEAAHVLLHPKRRTFIDGLPALTADTADDDLEAEADRWASQTLVPQEFEGTLASLRVSDIPAFAEKVGVCSAIIVGRLQHEKLLTHAQGNELRRRLAFNDTA